MDDMMKALLPPGVSEEWLAGYRQEIERQERERIITLIEDMMRTSCVIRDGDTGVWLVLSDLLRDIRNPK